jgi:hypothetical protein
MLLDPCRAAVPAVPILPDDGGIAMSRAERLAGAVVTSLPND